MDLYQRPVVNVLGATAIYLPAAEGRTAVPVSARKEREVLSLLALRLRRTVSPDQLIDAIWGTNPPRAAASTLQGYVAHIRRGLEPHRAPRATARVLRTTDGGYLLDLPDTHVDAYDFARRVQTALSSWPQMLSAPWPTLLPQDEVAWHTIADLESALKMWRGPAYADLSNEPAVEAERVCLNELYLSAVELVSGLHIALGKTAPAIATLGQLVLEHPLRENVTVLLGLALARAGRQSEALAALRRLAGSLREELGLDLSPAAQQLREAILRQDAACHLGTNRSLETRRVVTSDTFVGRDAEMARVLTALAPVQAGTGTTMVITGELGSGKSRLVAEIARLARKRGMAVVRVHVPEVPVAPPLWPIQQLVEKLGAQLRTRALPVPLKPTADDESFDYLREVLALVREASAEAPVMIEIGDVHRCDLDTLRVVRTLVDAASTMPLLLVLSRRPGPRPFDGRSGLGAALARANAAHLDLSGLATREVVRLAKRSAGLELTGGEGEELRRRADGNPYFIIELARSGKPLGGELPDTVVSVVEDELDELPDGVHDVLRPAAVIGFAFEVAMLEKITRLDAEALTDLLEPARESGFIQRRGDRYRFSRRLVREVLVNSCSSTERARWHAEIAMYLEMHYFSDEKPDLEVLAWHWRQAGAAYSDRAWRATRQAAREAGAQWAREDAADLFQLAEEVQRRDSLVPARERGELLLESARAQHAAGRLSVGHHCLYRAAVFAEHSGDLGLLSDVVTEVIAGQYWVHDVVFTLGGLWDGILTRFLSELAPEDSVIRCRTLMLRAIESGSLANAEKVQESCAAAIAMADRLRDGRLMDECLRGSMYALRRPDKVAERLELTHRLIAHSHFEGDTRSVAQARAMRATLLVESGDLEALTTELPDALAATQRQRLWSTWVTLGLMQTSWWGLTGADKAVSALLHQITEGIKIWSLAQFKSAVELTRMMTQFWAHGVCPDPSADLPQHAGMLAAMLKAALTGRGQALPVARPSAVTVPLVIGGDDHRSLFTTCLSAELAARSGAADAAEASMRWLEPYSGRMCLLGQVCLLGPVDAFLALACASLGDPRAEQYAAHAFAVARKWGMIRVTEWLETELKAFDEGFYAIPG